MELPKNRFKAALKVGGHQLGIWNTMAGPSVPELIATCGFDWALIDTEHSPIEVSEVQYALQAFAAYPDCAPIVRPVVNDAALIKRHLDQGAQTLLIPYVESAAEARAAVAAMAYGPTGVRGMAGMTRATRYGTIADYHSRAGDELCLIVQVETRKAMDSLEEIAAVPGVDGVFIGPADLSASLGHPGQTGHPDVVAAIESGIGRMRKLGVPVGIQMLDQAYARRCIELGSSFTSVGVDMVLLADATRALSRAFKG